MLAAEQHVSASTRNQTLSALLLLYREVHRVDLPWLVGVNRPTQERRIPSVLTHEEVASLFHVPARRNGTARPEWRHAAPCGRPTIRRSAAASSVAVTPT